MIEDSRKDGEVMGLDADGTVVLWNAKDQTEYNSGESLKVFGIGNLTENEKERVGVLTEEEEMDAAEMIAAILFDHEDNGTSDYTISEDMAMDFGRKIVESVKRKFRPESVPD